MTQRVHNFRLAVSLLLISSFSVAHASEEAVNTVSADSKSTAGQDAGIRPFTLFGGIGSGYGFVSGSDYAQAPGGLHVLLSGLAAYQLRHWELDAGASWLYSNISGQNVNNLPINVRTRAGTFDLGARYRIGDRWQVGPAMNLAFGTDTGFGPSVGNSQTALLMGAKAIYELPKMALPFRLWAQMSTDVSMDSHRLMIGLVGVQIGIPIKASSHPSVYLARESDVIHASAAAPVTPPQHEVHIVLDAQKVFFGTNSGALKPQVAEILRDVGEYLKNSPNRTAEVNISGHADQRGRYEYNLKLSRKRAETVRQALAIGGADPQHLEVKAYSYSKLLDTRNNRVAWARNRRVELTFQDIQDPAALREKLKPLAMDAPKENQ